MQTERSRIAVVGVLALCVVASVLGADSHEAAPGSESGRFDMAPEQQLHAMVAALASNLTHDITAVSMTNDIAALADSSFATTNGRAIRRGTLASRRIALQGEAALPDLIRASLHPAPEVRNQVLRLVYVIALRSGRLLDVLPVLVRALTDEQEDIRLAVVTVLGEMVVDSKWRRDGRLDLAVAALSRALTDASETVRREAARSLVASGHEGLVPQGLRHELGPE